MSKGENINKILNVDFKLESNIKWFKKLYNKGKQTMSITVEQDYRVNNYGEKFIHNFPVIFFDGALCQRCDTRMTDYVTRKLNNFEFHPLCTENCSKELTKKLKVKYEDNNNYNYKNHIEGFINRVKNSYRQTFSFHLDLGVGSIIIHPEYNIREAITIGCNCGKFEYSMLQMIKPCGSPGNLVDGKKLNIKFFIGTLTTENFYLLIFEIIKECVRFAKK